MSTYSNLFRATLAVSASFGALCVGTPAFAQDAQNSEAAAETGEIVVTSQFREQKLQDVPIAITAVDAALIESRSATNLADVVKAAPSVVLRPSASAFGNSISASIRGLGQGDFNPALEPGVGLYIDDVYYPRLTGANFDLLDVERVEVLRGPQGTLTGRNSEGGAIKFISRKPTGEGGYVSATYGSRNRINLKASADFTIAENLFARLSGTFADQGGYVQVIDYGCAFPASGVPTVAGGTNCNLYKQGDVGYKALKAIVRFNPSDALDISISADYNKDSRNSAAEVLLYGNNPNPNVQTTNSIPFDNRFVCGRFCNYTTFAQPGGTFTAGFLPFLQGVPVGTVNGQQKNEYEGYGISGNIDFKVSDKIQLQSISAYRAWDNSFTIDGDLSPARTQIGNNALDHWFWSQEFRINADISDQLQATLGAYYSDEETTYYTLQDIRYVSIGIDIPAAVCPLIPNGIPGLPGLPTATCPVFPLQFIGNDPVRTKSKAVFGTAIFKPADALTITGGFRYTKDSKDYTYFRFNLDGRTINGFVDGIGAAYGPGFSGPDVRDANNNGNVTEIVSSLTGRTASFRGSRWDYRFSADYRISPEVLVYATTGTGYKAGGVGPRPFVAGQARPFDPEEVTSYEVGFKTDLFDRKLRFNVAGYYNKLKDAQLTLLSCPQFNNGVGGPCALPQNAGDATIKGVEFEALFKPVSGLTIDAAASYIKYKYDCVDPQAVGAPLTATVVAGTCSKDPTVINRLAKPSQGWQWNLGIQYDADLGGSTLTPRIDINRQNRLVGNLLQPDLTTSAGRASSQFGQVPGYTLANARLTWRNADKDLDISLEVTNLFDKYYFPSKFDLSGLAGSVLGNPGRPREWGLTVKKKF
jgi:iron complex outermembrane recepter protein